MSYKIIQPDDVRFSLIINDESHIIDLSPDRWNDHQFSNKRDLSLIGVIRSYSTDVEFVGKSADLIRSVFYTDGVDGEIGLKIELLNHSTWQYETKYIGDLDLSTFDDQQTRVTCNIIDGGLSAAFQARKNVRYDIEFSEDDPIINLGTVDVPNFFTLSFYGDSGSSPAAGSLSLRPAFNIANTSERVRQLILKDYSQQMDVAVLAGVNTIAMFNPPNNYSAFHVFNESNSDIIAPLNGYFEMDLFFLSSAMVSAGISLGVIGVDLDSETMLPMQILYDSTSDSSITWDGASFVAVRRIDLDGKTLSFKSNSKYQFLWFVNNPITSMSGNARIRIRSASMTVKYDTPMQSDFLIKAKHPKVLFSDIARKINDDNDHDVVSDLLDDNFNLLITSGDAIRQLTNAQIKTSFDDFYKSINAVLNCGFGFDQDQNPQIEKKSYFFDNETEVFDFGDVTNVKKNPLTQVMISSILAGYSAQDYEIEKGIDEFNQGQEYTLQQKRVQNKLDIKSIFRADQYGIDSVRIKEINRSLNDTETDANTDNDVFFVLCKKELNEDDHFEPISQNDVFYIELNGSTLIKRSILYNFLISPKNNLYRHLDYVKSTLFGKNAELIDFQSADRNANLITIADDQSSTPVIYEKASIDFNDYFIERLFYPILIEFETSIKPSLQDLINNDSNGVFSFNHNGHVFKGFLFSIDLNANRGSSSVVQLILSPDNDLNLLI